MIMCATDPSFDRQLDPVNHTARKTERPTAAMIQVSKGLSLSRRIPTQKWNDGTYSHSIPRVLSI